MNHIAHSRIANFTALSLSAIKRLIQQEIYQCAGKCAGPFCDPKGQKGLEVNKFWLERRIMPANIINKQLNCVKIELYSIPKERIKKVQ